MATIIEHFQPGIDDEEVLGLRRKVWGRSHQQTNAGFYKWLFQSSPFGEGGGVLARREGRLIGFGGLCTKKVSIDGEEIPLAHGLDFMVEDGYRKGRVALKVATEWNGYVQDRNFSLAACFPNSNSARLLNSERLGWKPTIIPVLMVKPLVGLKFHEPLSSCPPSILNLFGNGLAVCSYLRGWSPPQKHNNRTIEKINRFDERFDRLWASVKNRKGIQAWRSSEYLNWRYADHPIYQYEIFACNENKEVLGFIVVGKRKLLGLDSLLIVDLLIRNSDQEVLSMLLRSLIESAEENKRLMLGAELSRESFSGQMLLKGFKRAGFFPIPSKVNPKKFVLMTQDYNGRHRHYLEPGGWDFVWGEMDTV